MQSNIIKTDIYQLHKIMFLFHREKSVIVMLDIVIMINVLDMDLIKEYIVFEYKS